MFDDARKEVGDFVVSGDGTGAVDCLGGGFWGALAGESAGSASGDSDD